jgi:hypothetical protein
MDKYTVVQVEFKEGELAGPDVEAGYRAYKDEIKSRDASSIQDWLERLQDLKKRTGAELQYVWRHLAQREHEFYQLMDENREKDIFRRELQLLNNMAADLVTRYAILGYHEADAYKRLQQIKLLDSDSQAAVASYEMPLHQIETVQEDNYGPHIVTEQVRTNWSRQKELLGHIEHSLSQYAALQPEEGTPGAEHSKQLQKNAEDLKKNVEATERLLKWFEQQVREADEQVKK